MPIFKTDIHPETFDISVDIDYSDSLAFKGLDASEITMLLALIGKAVRVTRSGKLEIPTFSVRVVHDGEAEDGDY